MGMKPSGTASQCATSKNNRARDQGDSQTHLFTLKSTKPVNNRNGAAGGGARCCRPQAPAFPNLPCTLLINSRIIRKTTIGLLCCPVQPALLAVVASYCIAAKWLMAHVALGASCQQHFCILHVPHPTTARYTKQHKAAPTQPTHNSKQGPKNTFPSTEA